MSETTISVIMPVCNEIEYLPEAVRSILDQTFTDFELLIIDGSDDKRLIPALLPEDDRIHYLYREKNGIADALNYGLENAHGRYIARMDADDISNPMRFEKQISFLEEHSEVDVVGTWFSIIKADGTLIEDKKPGVTHEQIAANLLFENPVCHPSVMFRRKVVDDGVRYPKTTAEDYALWTSMITNYRFAFIPEILLKWRRYDSTNTNLMMNKVCNSDIDSTLTYCESLFGEEFKRYENKRSLLIKNHFPDILRDTYRSGGSQFVMDEFIFLTALKKSCPIELVEEVKHELENRWRLILEIVGSFVPQMEELHNFSWNEKLSDDYCEFIKKILEENERERRSILNKPLSVIFYGMGKEGKDLLKRYQKAVNNGDVKWNLMGLFDRNVRSVELDGTKKEVHGMEKLGTVQHDMIIITSSIYYSEIEEDLIREGFDKNKIRNSSILNYVE